MNKRTGLMAALLIAIAPFGMADEVILDDLLIDGKVCVGETCQPNMDFSYSTLVLKDNAPRIYFEDTSYITGFPTVDWSVGVDAATGNFVIRNEDQALNVMQLNVTGNGIALGGGSTLVDGAVTVGAAGNERRVSFVADGTDATDAVTLGQLRAAQTLVLDDARFQAYAAQIATYETQLTDVMTQVAALETELTRVGAISSAMSALQPNPRSEGDHAVSVGIGAYGGETALAVGSFHYLLDDRIAVNTGVSRATSGAGKTAFRLGVTFGR